ncbi:unnamed protein product [Protopolystoma xenopodis]|uniref:Uncharacterized protein n=1 Tax=Protopolystoma xenopodis TaxID=117903 RepID=A0A448XGV9_9PLAT|nr:unnamed protein product [Protopolystoma xenopodis]
MYVITSLLDLGICLSSRLDNTVGCWPELRRPIAFDWIAAFRLIRLLIRIDLMCSENHSSTNQHTLVPASIFRILDRLAGSGLTDRWLMGSGLSERRLLASDLTDTLMLLLRSHSTPDSVTEQELMLLSGAGGISRPAWLGEPGDPPSICHLTAIYAALLPELAVNAGPFVWEQQMSFLFGPKQEKHGNMLGNAWSYLRQLVVWDCAVAGLRHHFAGLGPSQGGQALAGLHLEIPKSDVEACFTPIDELLTELDDEPWLTSPSHHAWHSCHPASFSPPLAQLSSTVTGPPGCLICAAVWRHPGGRLGAAYNLVHARLTAIRSYLAIKQSNLSETTLSTSFINDSHVGSSVTLQEDSRAYAPRKSFNLQDRSTLQKSQVLQYMQPSHDSLLISENKIFRKPQEITSLSTLTYSSTFMSLEPEISESGGAVRSERQDKVNHACSILDSNMLHWLTEFLFGLSRLMNLAARQTCRLVSGLTDANSCCCCCRHFQVYSYQFLAVNGIFNAILSLFQNAIYSSKDDIKPSCQRILQSFSEQSSDPALKSFNLLIEALGFLQDVLAYALLAQPSTTNQIWKRLLKSGLFLAESSRSLPLTVALPILTGIDLFVAGSRKVFNADILAKDNYLLANFRSPPMLPLDNIHISLVTNQYLNRREIHAVIARQISATHCKTTSIEDLNKIGQTIYMFL